MPTVRYGYVIGTQPYIDDRGGNQTWVSSIGVPSDLTVAQVETVVTAMGAQVLADPVPCSDVAGFTPRKVTFTRLSGSKTTIAVFSRASMVANVSAARDAFNLANGANPVVCIDLEGERWTELIDRLRTATVTPTPVALIQPPAADGKNKVYYKGVLSDYQADSATAFAAVVPSLFKLISDSDAAPPAAFGAALANCVGTIRLNAKCGGANQLETRRYLATFSTTSADQPYQQIEIPTSSAAPGDIAQCGEDLANLAHVDCLAYQGESRARYNEVLP